MALGHDVTLFATGNSLTRAKLISGWPRALRADPSGGDTVTPHVQMIEQVSRRAGEFDVLHFHFDHWYFSPLESLTPRRQSPHCMGASICWRRPTALFTTCCWCRSQTHSGNSCRRAISRDYSSRHAAGFADTAIRATRNISRSLVACRRKRVSTQRYASRQHRPQAQNRRQGG